MSERILPITMPKWGIEMQQGTIANWNVAPGQRIEKGQALLDVETEKIVNAVEAPYSGVLRRRLADTGATLSVGALVGVLAEADVSDVDIDRFVQAFKPAEAHFDAEGSLLIGTPSPGAGSGAPMPVPGSDASPGHLTAASAGAEIRVSPIARRLAERLGVDIGQVKGSGREGRVSKEDVEAYAAARSGTPAPKLPGTSAAPEASGTSGHTAADAPAGRVTPLSPLRAAIARKMSESKRQIPHYRLSIDVDCGALSARRDEIKASGQPVSLNDLWVRATALALMRHPLLNARFVDEAIHQGEHADVCVAIDTPAGLFAPVIRAAEGKTVAEIAANVRSLARRASEGSLKHNDTAGGTFTVSNLGMLGIDRFDAIINPPQVAILAVGAATDRLIVRDAAPAVARIATLTLSADHRVVDGAEGARFLATLKSLVTAPSSL